MLTITELEKDVLLNGIGKNDFYDYDYADVWSDMIIDTCTITTPEQISGVVSSLVKKNLITVSAKKTKDTSVRFTEIGFELFKSLGGQVQ